MKLKHLVAAMGVALVAAPSFATIIDPNSGNGELSFTIYGTGLAGKPDASYTLDLGILEHSFEASPSLSVTLGGANWDAFRNSIDLSTAQWAVLGGDNTGIAAGNRNLLTTVQIGSESNTSLLNNNNLTLALGELFTLQSNISSGGTHLTQANGDSFDPVGTQGYWQTNNGSSLNTKLPFETGNLIGTSAEFTDLIRSTGGLNPVAETVLPGKLSLTSVGGVYTLSYNVAAVPEPSGVVLALSALGVLGFAGRSRRNGRAA